MNNLTEELMNRTVPSVSYQGWELIAIDEEENDGVFTPRECLCITISLSRRSKWSQRGQSLKISGTLQIEPL